MSAIEDSQRFEEIRQMMSLAEGIDRFIKRYEPLISDERERGYFSRELLYLIQLAYREASQPLVKQIAEVLDMYPRPITFEAKQEGK